MLKNLVFRPELAYREAEERQEAIMTMWLYAASKAMASESDTLKLALESGFIWIGIPIACVRDIHPGDDILPGYRGGQMPNPN